MSKRILLCLSHSIEEYQQLDLLHYLGYEVASIGGYIDPQHPHDPKRPALDIPAYPELKAAVDALGTEDNLKAAQESIPDAFLDWLGEDGVIIYHHRLERLYGQWHRIRDWMRGSGGRRVIWRSVGQSVRSNEVESTPYRIGGLERVAYSPMEANIPDYSGHDAMIRFWGYPAAMPWTGSEKHVIQVSQHLRQRHPYTNWEFWESATKGLPRLPIGPGSEVIGGPGAVPYAVMQSHLATARVFLFTGSQPASYTLGLVEAMMAGIPTISIGKSWMRIDYGGHTAEDMFEGYMLAPLSYDDPAEAHHAIRSLLSDEELAKSLSEATLHNARLFFDREKVGQQWKEFLG